MIRPCGGRPNRPAALKYSVILAALIAICGLPRPLEAAGTRPAADSAAGSALHSAHPTSRTAHSSKATPAPKAAQDSARKVAPVAVAKPVPATTPVATAGPLRDLKQTSLKAPEKLLFDIIWGGWSFKWVHAGQATLELLPGDNPEHWEIRSLAWCNRFFRTFYPVRDTVTSLIDARGIYPLRFEKRLHEGGYNADISALYDQAGHTLKTQDTALSIEPFTHDVLSAFYYIRTRPLKVGDSFELAAVSGKKKYSLKVICHGRERVSVPAGDFETLVVEPMLKDDGLFKAKGKLTIWVTDDDAHVPVKMQSKIPVGSIKAELVSLP